jgi:hypothetical protein
LIAAQVTVFLGRSFAEFTTANLIPAQEKPATGSRRFQENPEDELLRG